MDSPYPPCPTGRPGEVTSPLSTSVFTPIKHEHLWKEHLVFNKHSDGAYDASCYLKCFANINSGEIAEQRG